MFKDKKNTEYGIIGLGRFGFALAKTLISAGKEVLVIDSDENKIKQIRPYTDNAFVLDRFDKEALAETGIQNCGTAIVCIGEKLDASILTTLVLINMKIPRVLAKAVSFDHGDVLTKIGAEVVYPENDMAIRLANRLLYSKALDLIELNDDINICELKVSGRIAGLAIKDSNIRRKYSLSIIAIECGEETILEVSPDHILKENELIVVIGKKNNITRFEEYLMSE